GARRRDRLPRRGADPHRVRGRGQLLAASGRRGRSERDMTQRAQLWERLTTAGIAYGPLPAEAGDRSPWYVRGMVGVAAWLAALFLLAFLGIALSGVLRNTTA